MSHNAIDKARKRVLRATDPDPDLLEALDWLMEALETSMSEVDELRAENDRLTDIAQKTEHQHELERKIHKHYELEHGLERKIHKHYELEIEKAVERLTNRRMNELVEDLVKHRPGMAFHDILEKARHIMNRNKPQYTMW